MKRFLKKIWEGWKKVAHKIGVFQTKLILTIFYFLILGIASLFVILSRRDLLDRRFKSGETFWKPREPFTPDLEGARRQF